MDCVQRVDNRSIARGVRGVNRKTVKNGGIYGGISRTISIRMGEMQEPLGLARHQRLIARERSGESIRRFSGGCQTETAKPGGQAVLCRKEQCTLLDAIVRLLFTGIPA